ncbi:MAG: leucine dehydrogenase [Defluviitaleaceae bacterium]|nr:leucine dehydrogenase [Defluviitaleaceae bacterium]MCL2835149.1 leucine dehydrogenase [Defluviitaleaceae bacterium]
MKIFDYMQQYGYEQLVYFHDKATDLKAITCIHSTVLGPSLGGTRIWNYQDEDEATLDVLRLARGMTYKSACAGLNLGGGKAVIIADPQELRKDIVRREAFFRSFGRFVEGLNGRYITAEDMNTTTQDMDYINMETNFVVGLEHKSGNPAPFTALGVYKAILACCEAEYGSTCLKGKKVLVQGIGAVGYRLCQHLHEDGAELFVSELNRERVAAAVEKFGAVEVDGNDVYGFDCDIFAPCAKGAGLNDETIPRLKCKIIAGAANNVLADIKKHGQQLHDRGIIYAPDYVANAGGVINVYWELHTYDVETVKRGIERIYSQTLEIILTSREKNLPTALIADQMAEARIDAMRHVNSIYLNKR